MTRVKFPSLVHSKNLVFQSMSVEVPAKKKKKKNRGKKKKNECLVWGLKSSGDCVNEPCCEKKGPYPIKIMLIMKAQIICVCSPANYSVAYEETQPNRVSDFRDFVCSLFPKAILFDFYYTVSISYIIKWFFNA